MSERYIFRPCLYSENKTQNKHRLNGQADKKWYASSAYRYWILMMTLAWMKDVYIKVYPQQSSGGDHLANSVTHLISISCYNGISSISCHARCMVRLVTALFQYSQVRPWGWYGPDLQDSFQHKLYYLKTKSKSIPVQSNQFNLVSGTDLIYWFVVSTSCTLLN